MTASHVTDAKNLTHHLMSVPFFSFEIVSQFGQTTLVLLLSLKIMLISIFNPGLLKDNHGLSLQNLAFVKQSSMVYSRL
jgi:hypothetical protein